MAREIPPYPRHSRPPAADTFIVAAIVIAALYAGSAVFIPLALAILLAFILAPAINALRKYRVPNTLATVVVLLVFLGGLAGMGAVITGQVTSLVEELPKYEQTLRAKVSWLRNFGVGSQAIDRAGETLDQLRTDLIAPEKPEQEPSPPAELAPLQSRPAPTALPAPPPAVPVEIRERPRTPLEQLNVIIGLLLAPLTTTGIVILFLIFILLERTNFRDRVIKILGGDDLDRSTLALTESAERLSRYLSTLAILNAGYGMFIAASLALIGVPSPVLWGIIAALMRFVPFVGSFIAAAFPVLLAAAVDPNWGMVGATLALFAVAEPMMGQFIEPVIQGRTTGLSTLAIIVATAFWTLLWGPIGLVLAVPLTLVLVAVGRHLEPLAFFNLLLSDEPALTPSERFYQRLLAGDADEIAEQAAQHLKESDLTHYYDEVVRPALTSAARDLDRERFDEARLAVISDSIEEVVSALVEDDVDEEGPPPQTVPVICMGARTQVDDAGAHIMKNLLTHLGIEAEVLAPGEWRKSAGYAPKAVCIGAFSAGWRLRRTVRIARRTHPEATLIVGLWHDRARERFDLREGLDGDVLIVTTFEDAAAKCLKAFATQSDQQAA